ncbi:MAG: flavodoxin-dependent (E)-4-hydroxy-3-methylbut-2-enyl-diphosphate synthase [Clostridia bacterium]|nr:flavodoxin-dependent (E)-4-hydroxy-3-methylbut-2-enyl-diphosphate synthase [Clostridia bacterium]
MARRITKEIKIGNKKIGNGNQIAIQSMLNIPAYDVEKNIEQAIELEKAGCDILRVAVPTLEDVRLIEAIKSKINIPLVADIHFDYRIALECIKSGVDKIRINPGNIGSKDKIQAVVNACNEKNIPIRIGVNSGSLEKDLLEKYKSPTAEALVQSALRHVKILEDENFYNIVISIKSSDVKTAVESYRLISSKCDYPLHLGITESGTYKMGMIKSSIGIGGLLLDGIGDTIRVSLTDNPVEEIKAGIDILSALGLRLDRPSLISCPTCGRTKIDLIKMASEVEERLSDVKIPIKVAVMGCVVNGPGEAKEADIGIAGGDNCAMIFKNGEVLRKVSSENAVDELFKEIERITKIETTS